MNLKSEGVQIVNRLRKEKRMLTSKADEVCSYWKDDVQKKFYSRYLESTHDDCESFIGHANRMLEVIDEIRRNDLDF